MPAALYGLSLYLSVCDVRAAGVCGEHLGEGQRDHAGRLHADPRHLHHRRHRHRVGGPIDDELLPVRPDGG